MQEWKGKGEAAESKTVSTKGYSTSFILSTFRKVEARQVLRRGTSEVVPIPESRVAERVFGAGMSGVAQSLCLGATYIPSCLQSMSLGVTHALTRLYGSWTVFKLCSGRI